MTRTRFDSYTIAMLLLCLTAFALSGLLSRTVFERLPHLEDEVAYLYQAKVFAAGHIVAPIPEPRRAYWQPFVVDYSASGHRFGKYTPGYPAVLGAGIALGQPWIMNALLAALTVALVYRLGGEVFNRDVGLLAALLVTFSPMALLLNATLMAHTTALFYCVLFMFACWRMEQGRAALRWGLVAGVAAGLLAITRPLPALALTLPFALYSGGRILARLLAPGPFRRRWPAAARVLSPLLLLAGVTLLIALATPAFNYAATGNPRQNLYELVWSYDRVGFGECCGRSGHTLEKALRHTRFDLSLTAADLFGWQAGALSDETTDHFLNQADYYPNLGLSFVLLPVGVLAGLLWAAPGRGLRLTAAGGWAAVVLAGLLWTINQPPERLQNPDFAWAWLMLAAAWLLLPLPLLAVRAQHATTRYTWLLWSVLLAIVLLQMTYWIGSQRYSTRYYYEALAAAALLSALPLAWLARRIARWPVYALLLALTLYSFFSYSLPRVQVLTGFNNINRQVLADLAQRRPDDTPVLVIVNGPDTGDQRVRWRAMGTLMAVTSPFLDSDIVVAWDYQAEGLRERILERFPQRTIIEMDASGNDAWFRAAGP